MTQLNLAPNDQIFKNDGKKSIGVLSAVVLAIVAFLIIGGLVYGAGKVSDFSQKIGNFNSFSDYNIPNDQNVIFNHNSQNANSSARNVNRSLSNNSVNQITNQVPINPSIGTGNNCVDSDSNLAAQDIYVKGVTSLFSNTGQVVAVANDSCRDVNMVEEVKCRKGVSGDNSYYLQRIPYPCPNGCANGACKE